MSRRMVARSRAGAGAGAGVGLIVGRPTGGKLPHRFRVGSRSSFSGVPESRPTARTSCFVALPDEAFNDPGELRGVKIEVRIRRLQCLN